MALLVGGAQAFAELFCLPDVALGQMTPGHQFAWRGGTRERGASRSVVGPNAEAEAADSGQPAGRQTEETGDGRQQAAGRPAHRKRGAQESFLPFAGGPPPPLARMPEQAKCHNRFQLALLGQLTSTAPIV